MYYKSFVWKRLNIKLNYRVSQKKCLHVWEANTPPKMALESRVIFEILRPSSFWWALNFFIFDHWGLRKKPNLPFLLMALISPNCAKFTHQNYTHNFFSQPPMVKNEKIQCPSERGGPEDFKNHPTFVPSAILRGSNGLSNMGTFFLGHPVYLCWVNL